jgi:hypothetical protein
MLFNHPSHYRGKIPIELYIDLQIKFPQVDGESDSAWLQRIKRDPTLARKMFGTPQFKTELIQAVNRRAAIAKMADAGAKRQGKDWKAWAPAQRYMDDAMAHIQKLGKDQATYAKEAYDQLMEQFDASTPPSGSVFWNGINELALMKKVDKWNEDKEVFAQLEATTAARYVNKQFVWETGGAFEKYFTEVSGKLGHAARGHVTAVCRCGLRFDSILTTTELPAMLKLMEDQIKAKKEPTITDITIVVIEPKLSPAQPHATFTNNDLTNVSIVRPLPGKRISGRDDCSVDRQLAVNSPFLKYYWAARGPRPESAAAQRIKEDLKSIITWP